MYVVVSQLLNRDSRKTKHLTKTSKQNQKRKKKEGQTEEGEKRQGAFIYICIYFLFFS